MKGVILAAGKGSRLYPVTHHIPKPILPLANRPTIHYGFDRLKEMGITDICVVVGENEDAMRQSLGDGADQGVQLAYVRQPEPKGLAHALGFTREFVGDDSFILYLGDAVYSRGFQSALVRFRETGCANLNVVKPVEDPKRFGVANVEGEHIVRLVEKPDQPESNLAMAGLYFFRSQIWEVLPHLEPSARGELEITDAIQMLVDREHDVRASIYEGEWFDTGTLDSFLGCSEFLLDHGSAIGSRADVMAPIGESVAVGADASVQATGIEDSVILPGAVVTVNGIIRHSIIGGAVHADDAVEGQVLFN